MRNRVTVNYAYVGKHFRDLPAGTIFERAGDAKDEALWIKSGTRCVDIHTGAAKSFDQAEIVNPLAEGTVITLTVGEAE